MITPRKDYELRYDGDPNTFVDGTIGSECFDASSGAIWHKTTVKGVLTGWHKLAGVKDAKLINAQTASYIAALLDVNKIVEISNASGNTFTLPPDTDVAFPDGSEITVVQTGAGLLTVTAGAGVTMTKVAATAKSLGRYSRIVCYKRTTSTWNINGDLAAS